MAATKAEGMNIIANCEEVAGQTVFHTHVHLVPRYSADDDLKLTLSHMNQTSTNLLKLLKLSKRLRSQL